MFEDRDAEVNPSIGFESNWKTTRSIKNTDCQTDEQVRSIQFTIVKI